VRYVEYNARTLDFYSIHLSSGLGCWLFHGTNEERATMKTYSEFTYGLTSALASRPHDWDLWQIIEEYSSDKIIQAITLQICYQTDEALRLYEKTFTPTDSPSKTLVDFFSDKSSWVEKEISKEDFMKNAPDCGHIQLVNSLGIVKSLNTI